MTTIRARRNPGARRRIASARWSSTRADLVYVATCTCGRRFGPLASVVSLQAALEHHRASLDQPLDPPARWASERLPPGRSRPPTDLTRVLVHAEPLQHPVRASEQVRRTAMRRLWVVVGGAVLLLDALILTGKILGPIDALREASVHYLSQVIALGFGPFEAVLVLGAVLLLSWAVVAGYRSRAVPWLLRAAVFLGVLLAGAGVYAAVDPPTTAVSVGRGGSVVGGGGFASGSLSTTGRFATTLPAVGVALIAGLAALIGLRALLQSRDTIVPVRTTGGA